MNSDPITKKDLENFVTKKDLESFGKNLKIEIEKSFIEKTEQIEKSFTEKAGHIERTFTEKAGQIERTFTEKVGQIEEKFFKYSRQSTGLILGGMGVMLALFGVLQYTFSNSKHNQPIVIYTYPQASQESSSGHVISGSKSQEPPASH